MDSDEDSCSEWTEPVPGSRANRPPNPSTPLGGSNVSEKHMVRKLFSNPTGSSKIPGGESEMGSFRRYLDRSLSGGNYSGGGSNQNRFSSPSTSAASSSHEPRVTPLQIRLADLTHDDSGEYEDELGEEEAAEEENEEAEGIFGVGDDTERPFDIMEVEPGEDDENYGEEEDEEFDEEEEIGEYHPGLEYTGNYYASNPSIPYYQSRIGHNLTPAATRIPFDRRVLPSTSSLVSTSSHSGQQGIKLHIRRATPGVQRGNQRQIPITISSNEASREAIGINDQSNSESRNSEDSDVVQVEKRGEIEISPVKISPLANTSRNLTTASSRLQGIVDSMREAKTNTEAQSRRIAPVPQQMLEKIRKLQNVELIEIDVDDQSDPEEVEAEVIQQNRAKLIPTKTLSKISAKAIKPLASPPTIVIDAAPSVPEKRKRGRPRGSKSEGGPSRRTERKRKPTTQFVTEMTVPRFKIRRRDGGENSADGDSQNQSLVTTTDATESQDQQRMFAFEGGEGVVPDLITTNSEVKSVKPRGRGRERPSTGRPRGRPRGSTLKSRMERDAASASVASIVEAVLNQSAEAAKALASPSEGVESPKKEGEAEQTEPTPTIRGGRRPRARGIARSPRGSRARASRGVRRTTAALAQEKPPKVKPASPQKDPLQVFEEETRMSADIKAPASINSNLGPPDADPDASNISSASTSVTGTASASASASASTKMKKFTKDFIDERIPVTAQTLFEYAWPNEPNAEQFMLQEQVSEYLGIKSFKRKYPDMLRRVVDMEERDFLRERKIVSETQCDLGLTALNSSDVLDVMYNDFPDKYEEFRKVIQERREVELLQQKQTTGAPPPARDRSAEFMRRIMRSTSRWNAKLNKERMEERSYSFDLQSFTLHTQQHRMKYVQREATKVGYYPVSILAGQYCDNYKRYTPTELKYLPLNTVCYGPLLPQEKPHPSLLDSEESQSDSDDSSSSSSSSSSSDEDEPETSAPQSVLKIEETSNSVASSLTPTPILVPEEKDKEKEKPLEATAVETESKESKPSVQSNICKTCDGDINKNKDGIPEVVIHCTKCDVPNHPSCLELSLDMLPFIKKYNWQCTDCKNCIECNDPADEDKMLFCDLCDRGYHIYCVGLRKVPTGRWHCRVCSLCHSCGANQPSQEDRTAEWHHEFKKGEKGAKHFMHSLCTSCHKLYKKGTYCPSCLKCHLNVDDKNVLECRSCEKKVHKDCVKRPLQSMFGFMCDPCDAAFRSKTKIPSHLN